MLLFLFREMAISYRWPVRWWNMGYGLASSTLSTIHHSATVLLTNGCWGHATTPSMSVAWQIIRAPSRCSIACSRAHHKQRQKWHRKDGRWYSDSPTGVYRHFIGIGNVVCAGPWRVPGLRHRSYGERTDHGHSGEETGRHWHFSRMQVSHRLRLGARMGADRRDHHWYEQQHIPTRATVERKR